MGDAGAYDKGGDIVKKSLFSKVLTGETLGLGAGAGGGVIIPTDGRGPASRKGAGGGKARAAKAQNTDIFTFIPLNRNHGAPLCDWRPECPGLRGGCKGWLTGFGGQKGHTQTMHILCTPHT